MPTLRQLAIRLASTDEAVRPILLPLLKTANGTDVQRAVAAALKGWQPKLSAGGYTLQFYSLLKGDSGVQKALNEDMRHAHLRDYKLDWAEWFKRPVDAWARPQGTMTQREARGIKFQNVVTYLAADRKRVWEKLKRERQEDRGRSNPADMHRFAGSKTAKTDVLYKQTFTDDDVKKLVLRQYRGADPDSFRWLPSGPPYAKANAPNLWRSFVMTDDDGDEIIGTITLVIDGFSKGKTQLEVNISIG